MSIDSVLTLSQASAIEFVREQAKLRKSAAVESNEQILRGSNISRLRFAEIIQQVKLRTRVALHFHPDRLDPEMNTVAQSLLESGLYKSQFETLLSSGSVSAYSGGERDLWEKKLFGGAYQKDGSDHSKRPKYGALDLLANSDGPAPRFGSCYFLLKPEVSQRCTFTYLDSHTEPIEQGTLDEFDDIIAALLRDSYSDQIVLGERLRPQELLDAIWAATQRPFSDRFRHPHRRILDHYIEAQVHGPISLKEDVESLVADPSFRSSESGKYLAELSKKFEIGLHWHAGYELLVEKVPPDFRGPTMPSLARRVAPDGVLNAKKIGVAAALVRRAPHSWADRGSESEVLQELKLLWHVLLKFGDSNKTIR